MSTVRFMTCSFALVWLLALSAGAGVLWVSLERTRDEIERLDFNVRDETKRLDQLTSNLVFLGEEGSKQDSQEFDRYMACVEALQRLDAGLKAASATNNAVHETFMKGLTQALTRIGTIEQHAVEVNETIAVIADLMRIRRMTSQ